MKAIWGFTALMLVQLPTPEQYTPPFGRRFILAVCLILGGMFWGFRSRLGADQYIGLFLCWLGLFMWWVTSFHISWGWWL